jgi:nucleoside-diphosphate-sugar epimerase
VKVLITGAAGFVGSHAARALEEAGHDVVATDIVETPQRLAGLLDRSRVRYHAGDLAETLPEVMPGVQQVWLRVLGDGRQRKSYVLVDDIIAGMRWIAERPPAHVPVNVVNLAAGDSLDVAGVAAEVATAMGLPAPRIITADTDLSWAGDQPVIELGTDLARSTGWRPTADAATAVRTAAERLLAARSAATSS